MKSAQIIIEEQASQIMAYWNTKKGTNYTEFSVETAAYTCSSYLSIGNDEEGIRIRFSDHQGTRGGVDYSLPYSSIVNDLADEEWLEINDIHEDSRINYRDERFELSLENLDWYLR
jgi:hypothetical protein